MDIHLAFIIGLTLSCVWIADGLGESNKVTEPPSSAPDATMIEVTVPDGKLPTTVNSAPTGTTSRVPTTSSKRPMTTSSKRPTTTSSKRPTTTMIPSTQSTVTTTTAAPSTCTMNGRFVDTSDNCGQSYILCSWNGSAFQMWRLKCPGSLVFFQKVSRCVRSALPAGC